MYMYILLLLLLYNRYTCIYCYYIMYILLLYNRYTCIYCYYIIDIHVYIIVAIEQPLYC